MGAADGEFTTAEGESWISSWIARLAGRERMNP